MKESLVDDIVEVGVNRMPPNAWRVEADILQARLRNEPGNLELARQFWAMIGGECGYDVRNWRRLLQTFSVVAYQSDEGLAEFIAATRSLVEEIGEYPDTDFLNPPLANKVRAIAMEPEHWLSEEALWFLNCC